MRILRRAIRKVRKDFRKKRVDMFGRRVTTDEFAIGILAALVINKYDRLCLSGSDTRREQRIRDGFIVVTNEALRDLWRNKAKMKGRPFSFEDMLAAWLRSGLVVIRDDGNTYLFCINANSAERRLIAAGKDRKMYDRLAAMWPGDIATSLE